MWSSNIFTVWPCVRDHLQEHDQVVTAHQDPDSQPHAIRANGIGV